MRRKAELTKRIQHLLDGLDGRPNQNIQVAREARRTVMRNRVSAHGSGIQRLAFNQNQSPAKPIWLSSPQSSDVLPSQPFYLGDPLLRGTAQPVDQGGILLRIPLKRAETEDPFHSVSL